MVMLVGSGKDLPAVPQGPTKCISASAYVSPGMDKQSDQPPVSPTNAKSNECLLMLLL